ncbi:(+)-cis,trans-nepetalactol synthase NEPS1-like [Alnus glutinosa]|uniref:(+)-cis,trans-nepetalactol synthase NEPS1-like n=1 Tax=Alnus glutinosa TaxID=3517 RepID=UPI002D777A7A|nr:(+)-cis,trans-nepetalactol synthase NEPS1-like [Alnus glutinosa]
MTDSSAVPNNSLQGKVAIITGGASGIGEATARLFAQHGTRMVVIADIQDQLGHQVATSIGIDKCNYVHCDVADEDQVKTMVESTVQKHGQLDIMFSNAGILSASDQTVLELDFLQFDRLFAVNARGMALCVKHAARVMVEGRVRGNIVCTGSVAASHGGKRRTDYCMSKHAVLGLVRSASVQLGVHGIRVNCVSPNALATPLTIQALGKSAGEIEKAYETYARLKGAVLNVKDIADAVLFLARNEFVTGHDLLVDGSFVSQ